MVRRHSRKPGANRGELVGASFILLQANPASKEMTTLAYIFEQTLPDIYYAENAITKALPKVAKAATDAKLKKAGEDHLE